MSDRDQMTDSVELRELRNSFSDVALPERPPLEAIKARGRTRRRRRLSGVAGLSVAGFAASAALALGVTGGLGRAPTHGTVRTLAPSTIRTASFTLRHNHDGTATLTINPKELLDSSALHSALAKYRIPAKVTTGSFCSSDPAPAGFSKVVSGLPAPEPAVPVGSGKPPTITIDPPAMPAGTELSFGNFQLPTGQQQADSALIDTSSYTCISTRPAPTPPGPNGFQLTYGGPARS